MLAVASAGGLDEAQIASWLFGAFFINGLLTVAFCVQRRQPLIFFWTIPGTVLVGPALAHATMPEIVGAYLATGLLMLALGLSGLFGRLMRWLPMPIVMGMVAGVFLRFGTDLVLALHDAWPIALPMTLVFVLFSALPVLAARVPALIAALIAGVLCVALGVPGSAMTGAAVFSGGWAGALAQPVLVAPAWSVPTMIELVLPLAITVLFVQNGQGFAVLAAAGHKPPIDAVTTACGATSIAAAFVGTVSTCLTGPSNALATASGETHRHYTAGVVTGVLAIVFGLFSPVFTRLMIGLPPAFIATLAGLAMLKVLQGAFATAFKARHSLGALVAFLVTVAAVPLAGIGAPFWGIVFGVLVSLAIERDDWT